MSNLIDNISELNDTIMNLIETFENDNHVVIEGISLEIIPVPSEQATSKRHITYSSRNIGFEIKPV